MKQHTDAPSLIPYLQSEGQCAHLSISFFSDPSASLEETHFPFVILSDRDPFSLILDARFLTDSGAVLKHVMLVLQRDNYRIAKDHALPTSNLSMEELWRKALACYAENERFPLITLSGQMDQEDGFVPFQPILFCKTRREFFHPPCPSCGLPLKLCRDDRVLGNAGLPGFSSSLNRYLFCPPCNHSLPPGRFYAYEPGNCDPPSVKDRFTLIREFRQLLQNPDGPQAFPCRGCIENNACFGPEQKAFWRIIPFSFYPFFLLIFESMPLEGPDFLALLSGASWEEMEIQLRDKRAFSGMHHLTQFRNEGEGRSSFLFRDDDRFFLEALYLKLTFLAQVTDRAVATDGSHRLFQPELSLDRTWVKLTGRSSHLPYFWNFEIHCIDITGGIADSTQAKYLPSSYSLYSFGMTWFRTLLANARQSPAEVCEIVHGLVERSLSVPQRDKWEKIHSSISPVFHPGNLFWLPNQDRTFPPEWLDTWEDSLNLGWTLIRAGYSGYPLVEEQFRERLRALRGRIIDRLFSGEPKSTAQEMQIRDQAISEVLDGIKERWERERLATRKDETITETLVLPRHFSMDDTLPLDFNSLRLDEEPPETHVISPRGARATPSSPSAVEISTTSSQREEETEAHEMTNAEKTVIAGPRGESAGELLPETIIIPPSRRAKSVEAVPTESIRGSMGTDEKDETPEPGSPHEDEPGTEVPEEETMVRTVVIHPRKDAGKERKDS